jgi:hypothetical protein
MERDAADSWTEALISGKHDLFGQRAIYLIQNLRQTIFLEGATELISAILRTSAVVSTFLKAGQHSNGPTCFKSPFPMFFPPDM